MSNTIKERDMTFQNSRKRTLLAAVLAMAALTACSGLKDSGDSKSQAASDGGSTSEPYSFPAVTTTTQGVSTRMIAILEGTINNDGNPDPAQNANLFSKTVGFSSANYPTTRDPNALTQSAQQALLATAWGACLRLRQLSVDGAGNATAAGPMNATFGLQTQAAGAANFDAAAKLRLANFGMRLIENATGIPESAAGARFAPVRAEIVSLIDQLAAQSPKPSYPTAAAHVCWAAVASTFATGS